MAEKTCEPSPEKDPIAELRIKTFQREFAKIKDFSDPYPQEESIIGHCMGALAGTCSAKARGFLKKTLRESKNEAQARFLLSKLIEHGGSPAVDLLIEEFSSRDSATINFQGKGRNAQPANYRVLLATAFLGAKSPLLVPALCRNLQESSNNSIKILCATALGMIADERAMDALENALKDKDAQVREHAACAIAEIGSASAIQYFREISKSMLEHNIEYAVKNLIKIRSRKVVPVLSRVILDDKAKWLTRGTRISMARALGDLGDKRAIPALVELARKERSDAGQIAAIYAIGRIGGEEALEALRSLAGNQYSGKAANAALYRMTADDTEKLECIPRPSSTEDLKRRKKLTSG